MNIRNTVCTAARQLKAKTTKAAGQVKEGAQQFIQSEAGAQLTATAGVILASQAYKAVGEGYITRRATTRTAASALKAKQLIERDPKALMRAKARALTEAQGNAKAAGRTLTKDQIAAVTQDAQLAFYNGVPARDYRNYQKQVAKAASAGKKHGEYLTKHAKKSVGYDLAANIRKDGMPLAVYERVKGMSPIERAEYFAKAAQKALDNHKAVNRDGSPLNIRDYVTRMERQFDLRDFAEHSVANPTALNSYRQAATTARQQAVQAKAAQTAKKAAEAKKATETAFDKAERAVDRANKNSDRTNLERVVTTLNVLKAKASAQKIANTRQELAAQQANKFAQPVNTTGARRAEAAKVLGEIPDNVFARAGQRVSDTFANGADAVKNGAVGAGRLPGRAYRATAEASGRAYGSVKNALGGINIPNPFRRGGAAPGTAAS